MNIDVYTEVYSDSARAERIITLVHAVAQGWMLIGWSAFEHPHIARLYSYPGMDHRVFEGALMPPPEAYTFPDRFTALVTLREEYRLAKRLLIMEEEDLVSSGARKAAFNAMRSNLVGKVQETISEQLQTPSEGISLGLLFEQHTKLIDAVSGNTPSVPMEVHNHKHLHVRGGEPTSTGIDWQAGLKDLGAITQPQKSLAADSVEAEVEETD